MPTNWNIQWLNHNSQRNYPLADTASGWDITNSFQIPTSFIVELDIPVHAGLNVGPAGFFIQALAAFASGYGIIIGYQPEAAGASPVTVATALIPAQNFTPNSVFALGGIGVFSDIVGKLVIGSLTEIDAQPAGSWTFSLATAMIDPDAVRPIIQGVASLICVNGDQTSVNLYGDVEFVAGSNMQIVPIIQEGQDPIIVFNALSGEGTVDPCVCTGDEALTNPIVSINGIAPTPAGNINIVGSDCINVAPITNGLMIEDTCSQPCCGCPELEQITSQLETLGSQAASVQQFVNQLESAVNTMSTSVLGSTLQNACSPVCPPASG